MNDVIDVPREKLTELLAKYGDALWQDRDRCEGLLRDHCGAYRREISALTAALHERVPQELKSSWQTAMTPEAMRARLIQRLEDNCGLAPQVAAWATDTWAYALKVPLGRISDRVDSEAIAPALAAAAAAATPSSGSVWIGPANQPGSASGGQQLAKSPATQGSGSGPSRVLPGLLSKPAARSSAGVVLVAVCALGFFLLHKPQPNPQLPCANKAADGTCISPSPSPSPSPPAPNPEPAYDGSSHKPQPTPQPPCANKTADGTCVSSSTPPSFSPPVPNPGPAYDGSTHVPVPANTVVAGTPLRIRVNEELSSASATEGQYVGGTLLDPLLVSGKQISAPGARAVLLVKMVTAAGKISGRSELGLTVYEIYINNRPVRVSTNEDIRRGPSKTVGTAKKAGMLGVAGCVVGGVIGKFRHSGGKGCAIGGGTGAGGGVVLSAASEAHPATIAPETILQFHLTRPLAIRTTGSTVPADSGSQS